MPDNPTRPGIAFYATVLLVVVPIVYVLSSGPVMKAGAYYAQLSPSGRDDKRSETGEQTALHPKPATLRDSRAWYILSQADGIDLLFGMPQRLENASEQTRRQDVVWRGVEAGGSVELAIEVEGSADGEIVVGFFTDPRWWISAPNQVRAFEKPGRYLVERLPPGKYYIGALIGTAVQPMALGVHREWPAPLTVIAGETTRADLRVSTKFKNNIFGAGAPIRKSIVGNNGARDPTKTHAVRIVDQNDQPTPFSRVTIVEWRADDPEKVHLYHDLATDDRGEVQFDRFAGPFSVIDQRFEFNPTSMISRNIWTKRSQRYDKDQQTIERVAAKFPEGSGTIRGRVHNQHGQPLTEFFLSLTRFLGDKTSAFASSYGIRIPVIDAEGRFEASGLAPGTYTLMVRHFDYPTHVWHFEQAKC